MRSGGNTLPWKLLSLLLALALALSLWTGHRGPIGQAEGGTVADTVTVGLKLAPTNLDIRNQSGTALDQLLIGNVYQGLVSRDSRNRVRPGLAKSWNVSEDGLIYTFHLHEGIRSPTVMLFGLRMWSTPSAGSWQAIIRAARCWRASRAFRLRIR